MLPAHSIQNGFLAYIPPELQLEIFHRLDYISVVRLASTNKYFNSLVDPQQIFELKRAALGKISHDKRHHFGCFRISNEDENLCEEEVIGFSFGPLRDPESVDVHYCVEYILCHSPIAELKSTLLSDDLE